MCTAPNVWYMRAQDVWACGLLLYISRVFAIVPCVFCAATRG